MKRRALVGAAAVLVLVHSTPVHAGAYEDFFKAVQLDDARTVSTLLARGFDPNSSDERGHRALYVALRDGSFKVAEALLVSPELQVDASNAFGETALMMAALRGQVDWVQRLLARGAQVQREGWTPLHYAASGPEPRLLTLLLERGAQIDARAPNGNTALMMAAAYGAIDGADLLLARGADSKLRNAAGASAADLARRAGRDALAERLERAAR